MCWDSKWEVDKANNGVCVYHVAVQMLYNITSLGRAWASPTLAWLHCTRVCVCLFVCLGLDRPLTVNFKWAHSNISRWWNVHADLIQQTTEQKPDCSVAVKESEDDLSWMHWQHAWQLCELWCEYDDRVTVKAGYKWPWPVTVHQTLNWYACFRYAPGMTALTQQGSPC